MILAVSAGGLLHLQVLWFVSISQFREPLTEILNSKILYNIRSLMTPIVLVRLQNTPLCLLHWFISDSTSRYYNLSSYNEFWALDLFCLECWQPAGSSQLTGCLNAP
jgi:hypothetical protein